MTIGLLPGQDVFTVPTMHAKVQAQVRGMGVGFLPESFARPLIEAGHLVAREVARPRRVTQVGYAWRIPDGNEGEHGGRALQWWLKRSALLVNPRRQNTVNTV
jgi:DNA-binding transcriptional LysR family regulator